ncbi:MAG: hypothetical protein ACF8NJ_01435 [Phycisphaerales bacterium JB038]
MSQPVYPFNTRVISTFVLSILMPVGLFLLEKFLSFVLDQGGASPG